MKKIIEPATRAIEPMGKDEISSIARTIFSTSDSKFVRDADCDRRFMIVGEKAREIGFVKTDELEKLPIDEAESHVDFLASFKVVSELIR